MIIMVVPKRAPAAEVDIHNFSGETANMWRLLINDTK